MFEVPEKDLALIKKIFQKHVPDLEVRAFGSRVNGKPKPYSDLDLVVVGPKRISRQVIIQLKDELQESNLPFRVDLLDWHQISEEFKEIITKNFVVIQPSAER